MRKFLTTSLLLLICVISFAQSADKGLFKVKLGAGAGILSTSSNTNVDESGIAVPTIWGIGFEYNTKDRLSIGLETFSHTYQGDSSFISIGGGAIGLDVKYFLTNKPKSNIYLGTTLGGINLMSHSYNYPDSNSIDSVRKEVWFEAAGVYNKVYLGFNKYFNNVLGIYLEGGLLNVPFRMRYVTVDDDEVEFINKMPINRWNFLLRGAFVNFGVALKFGSKKKIALEEESDGATG